MTFGLFDLDHLGVSLAQRQLSRARSLQWDLRGATLRIDLSALGYAHVHDAALYRTLAVKPDNLLTVSPIFACLSVFIL